MVEASLQLAGALGPVTDAAQRLAGDLNANSDARFVADQCMKLVFPERADDDRFREAMLCSSFEKIDAMWRIIGGHDELEMTTPLGAFAFAETAAEIGITLPEFEQVYRVGAGLVWLCWYRHALERAAMHDVPVADLIGAPTLLIHAYIDRVFAPVYERYDAARTEHMGNSDHRQQSILRQVLAGTKAMGEAETEQALGVSLDGEHIAFVIRGDRRVDPTELAVRIKRSCGISDTLVYRHDSAPVVWLSSPGRFKPTQLRRVREALERAGAQIAMGEPSAGLAGLGATGRDAMEASRLQQKLGTEATPLLSFADVRLESLFLSEPERARRFVQDELGPLDSADARMRRLRDTALVWLTAGSHVSAATQLGVHEHTVRNRVAQIEELLGRPLAGRRTELLVALRLKRILDDDAPRVAATGSPRA
ncbi:helix-turn-helix domain-containing protein [Sporichthya sp.]|uniref:PucR family transcriptional regulator n=1 Tax=Sporichthya sp. TaxID=65475 RepID=UPI00180EDB17|nr:helix-turn-helix domain-containing protein [Sporichthya sp.]MBA3745056.1 helix-turn-helix domain-containing protein [Sporichthya sp.]